MLPKKLIGTILMLGSVVLTSSSQVYYGMFIQKFNPYFFILISFTITLVFFQIIELSSSKKEASTLPFSKVWKEVVMLNILTAMVFIFFYVALKYVEPAIVSAIEWGIGPVIALLLMKSKSPFQKLGATSIIASSGVFIGTIFLVWASLNGESGVMIYSHTILLMGLVFSFLTGIGNVAFAFFSKQLSDQGWSSTKILSQRFFLIIFIAGFIVWFNNYYQPLDLTDIGWILLITLSGTIFPLYLLQLSLKYCSPFMVLIISSLVPCITFFFQMFDPRIELSYFTLIGVIIITIFGFLIMFKKEEE
jgi:drug/metabolite transporter (DMT)-like permease